jgi:malate/lactate dehydrogenase
MKLSQSQTAVVTATALVLLMRAPASLEAQFQTTSTTFSGQATAVSGKILGTPITLIDTGPVDAAGGQLEAHAVC